MRTFKEDSNTRVAFLGEVSEPSSSPTVTGGLIEFCVHPLQGTLQPYHQAQLISRIGEIALVMVRATSYKQFEQSAWQPGDFRVRVEGIDLVQAQTMQTLQQEPLSEGVESLDSVDAQEIIRLLEEPVENGLPIKRQLIAEAPLAALLDAIQEPKTTDTYEILCEILGKRKEAQALPCLIEALQNTHAGVRAEAAQALAMIGKEDAGEALLRQYVQEEADEAKEWEVIALGAVGYRPAIPYLIQALAVKNLRGYAALALGNFKAQEARAALQQALAQETDPYTAKLLRQGLSALKEEQDD